MNKQNIKKMDQIYFILLILAVQSCTNSTTTEPNKFPKMFELSPVSFENGRFVASIDTTTKDRAACLLTINNQMFDTMTIVENTTLNDSIYAVNPDAYIKFNKRDSTRSAEVSYLTTFGIRNIKIAKCHSGCALLLNARYFDRDSIDHYNTYSIKIDSSGTCRYITLKIRSSNLAYSIMQPDGMY